VATVGQTVVEIGADGGAAEAVATALADQLVSTPESDWLITCRNRYPRPLS
jgi:shikimate 5-dehydrogenase